MPIFKTLAFVANHPLNRERRARAIFDLFKWQIGSRLVPGEVLFKWINGSRIIVRRGEAGVTGNLYCGLHEFEDMAYLLHVLSPEDLFVDVGANVGSYTILACAARGARGYCFEPVPATFVRLLDNLRVNDLEDRVIALNIGLSDRNGELQFTSDEDTTNHIVGENESAAGTIRVQVRPLDEVLEDQSPSVIKIDVEGFETAVIEGAAKTLASSSLHSVVMELNGSGERYGFDEDRIVEKMKSLGFAAYRYDPFKRELSALAGDRSRTGNTLFVRDPQLVNQRLEHTAKIQLGIYWL